MSANKQSGVQVLVCQHGSRHRYAIPRMLEEDGILAGLYTDSTAYSPIGRLAAFLKRFGLVWPRMDALLARCPPGIPRSKVFSSDRLFFASWPGISEDLSAAYIRRGLQGANVVFNMFGEDIGFVEWAKARGCRVIVDVFVHPGTTRIVAEEHSRFLGVDASADQMVRILYEHHERTFKLADILSCPSGWVADGVREMFPQYAHKIRVVPYGSSFIARARGSNSPVPGRILFAGRESLRKGLHYLAEAAHLVREAGLDIEVRVAGIEKDSISWIEHKGELQCLGSLPSDQMQSEFESADVFVLPSLSEGQASVILEAMACGCPVIATRESGVDFMPDCGVIVPSRDARALADAIAEVVGNRSYRSKLAEGALRQASEYSMETWKQRLTAVVEEAASLAQGDKR